MTKHDKFLCTRPTLAVRLQDKGFTCEVAVNPFDSSKSAWLFEKTPQVIEEVTKYYNEIGKPVPHSLKAGETE